MRPVRFHTGIQGNCTIAVYEGANMVERLARPKVPALPRLVPLPNGVPQPGMPTLEVYPEAKPVVDEFGLDVGIYGNFPREQRRLLALAIRDMDGSKRARPPLGATIPEAIFYGLLVDNGFSHRPGVLAGSRHFIFQSYQLGGRQPGGAVVDFMVYYNGARIAVRVQSVFHALRHAFSSGGQTQQVELRLKEQLLAAFFIDDVVDVNEPPERVLETRNDPARIKSELDRVLYGR